MDQNYCYGNTETDSIPNILNSAEAQMMRKTLSQDKDFSACNTCYSEERSGFKSVRQSMNELYKDTLEKLEQLNFPLQISPHDIQYIDIRFSNICNFACRICSPFNSSSWIREAESITNISYKHLNKLKVDLDKIWNELNQIIPNLNRVYFAGGEPLLSVDHYRFLDLLLMHNKNQTMLAYSTNLSSLKFQDLSIADYWSLFDNVNVAISIDGVNRQGEFLRKGLKWELLKSNYLSIKNDLPHVQVSIAFTISAINAFHLTESLDYWLTNEWITTPSDFTLNFLNEPFHLNLSIFSSDEIHALENHYQLWLKNQQPFLSSELWNHFSSLFHSVVNFARQGNESNKMNNRTTFRKYMFSLDKLRNEKTLELFPDLFPLFIDAKAPEAELHNL